MTPPAEVSVADLVAVGPNVIPSVQPYVQLARWVKAGLLRPTTPEPGPGQDRGYTIGDLRAVAYIERCAAATLRTGRTGGSAWHTTHQPVFDYLHAGHTRLAPFLIVDLVDGEVHACEDVRRAIRCADALMNVALRQCWVVLLAGLDDDIKARLDPTVAVS